jgi:hypothetical protein
MLKGWVWQWLMKFDEIDARVFKNDRPAWDAAYANVSSSVVAEMHELVDLSGEGPCEDLDENGKPQYPPSPRWSALDELVKAKQPERICSRSDGQRKNDGNENKVTNISRPSNDAEYAIRRLRAARSRGNVKRSGKTTRTPKPVKADHAGEYRQPVET